MMELIYGRPKALLDIPNNYCAGCSHGLIQKLIAEVVDEMDIREKFVYGGGIGCNGMGMFYFNTDAFSSLHGRAAAAGSAFKRVSPDSVLMIYQGDGDAASIGLAETMHAACRGEAFTVIMANNSIYGMTGGQMSPTTLEGAKTSTSHSGRQGYPMHVAEMVASQEAPDFVARCSVHNPKHILQFKKAITHAFKRQIDHKEYSFIEVLAVCPTGIHIKPEDSIKYIENEVIPVFPIKEFKRDGVRI